MSIKKESKSKIFKDTHSNKRRKLDPKAKKNPARAAKSKTSINL